MGLTLSANNCPTSLDGGYGMLFRLRSRIAKDYDKEFGEHYETMIHCSTASDWKRFNAKTNSILRNDRFLDEDADIIDFLFASDCDGKIDHKTCKKILNVIKDDDEELNLVYGYWSDGHDWQHFKELLQWCYSHRAKMYWR